MRTTWSNKEVLQTFAQFLLFEKIRFSPFDLEPLSIGKPVIRNFVASKKTSCESLMIA